MLSFRVYRDGIGAYRWRIVAADGRTLAISLQHTDTQSAQHDIDLVLQAGAGSYTYMDETDEATRSTMPAMPAVGCSDDEEN